MLHLNSILDCLAAGYQSLGSLRSYRINNSVKRGIDANNDRSDLACENINSNELFTEMDDFDNCNAGTIGSGASYGPAQRECKGLVTAVCTFSFIFPSSKASEPHYFLSKTSFFNFRSGSALLCNPYGRAMSGFCQPLIDVVEKTCNIAQCVPKWPWTEFELNLARPESDSFCYNDLDELRMSVAYKDVHPHCSHYDTLFY